MLVGTTAVTIAPAYFGRNFLLIKNNGPGSCAVNLTGGTAVLATRGNIQLASGQQVKFEKNVPQGAINAISASTSAITVLSDDSLTAGAQPSWILNPSNPPTVDLDFQNAHYFNSGLVSSPPVTVARTTVPAGVGLSTNLVPTSASGFAFSTFANNVLRITPGLGLLSEEGRINQLTASTVPANQTTASLANGTYTLWVNGSGTATVSVGTATAAALPLIASQGVPQTFAITNPGTLNLVVAGSLNAFQLELGIFGTSLIVTGGATGTRGTEVFSYSSPPVFGAAFTFLGQGTSEIALTTANSPWLISVNDNSAANQAGLFMNRINGFVNMNLTTSSVSRFTVAVDAVSHAAASVKMAMALAAGDQIGCAGGTLSAAQTITPIFLPNQISVGGGQVQSDWNGYVERIVVWPTQRLANATLQSLTT